MTMPEGAVLLDSKFNPDVLIQPVAPVTLAELGSLTLQDALQPVRTLGGPNGYTTELTHTNEGTDIGKD